MDNTLVVEVDEPFEDLGDVHSYEVFRELAESLGDIVERAVLTESGGEMECEVIV